jgi:CDP-glucose 4,6-dehydratase
VGHRRGALENLVMRSIDRAFWQGRRVLVTGHTGFKGAWLALLLDRLGAKVTGIALPPDQEPSAFALLGIGGRVKHHEIDIRDRAGLAAAVAAAQPDIVLHLAAQALVGRSYRDPVGTFETNVAGTVNLLQALRGSAVQAAVIVTSDKVYRNEGIGRPFVETDRLGGNDPYSASKAACEIVVASYIASFGDALPPMATARAGNVIGGGDFAEERLIPDLVRAETAGCELIVRRPDATRPFQHLFDVLTAYLLLAETLGSDPRNAPRAVNVGPEAVETPVRALLDAYGTARGRPVRWRPMSDQVFPEAQRLTLDASLIRTAIGWMPRLDLTAALTETAQWYEAWRTGEDMSLRSVAAIDKILCR